MNKTIAFILFSFFVGTAYADNADLARKIYSFCQSQGGKVEFSPTATVKSDGTVCVKSACSIDSRTNGGTCDVNIDTQSLPSGCARAALETCGKVSEGGTPSGSGNGTPSGSGNGNGTPSGSGNGNGTPSGSGNGNGNGNGTPSGSGSGNGTPSGSGNGNGTPSGSGSGGGETENCITKDGQVLAIGPYHRCYESCKASGIWPFRKRGLERKSCVECLMGMGYDFDITVKKKAGVVMVGGVSVTVCYDANGREVSRTSSGSCPSGSSGNGTTNVGYTNPGNGSGNGNGNGNGNGSVGGSVSVGAGGSVQLPDYCNSSKQSDINKCQEFINKNWRFLCSSGANLSRCTGGADIDIMSRYDTSNCVNCQAGGRPRATTLQGIAEIAGALAPVAATGLSAYFGYKSNQAWAGAATAGFEQCQLDHNNYYQYLAANELPGLTPQQQAGMNCNGFQLGGFGGMGAGGLGGWYGAGYTPGFIGGMMGPYGGYNPYGMGGYVGGVAGGMAAGMAGGIGIAGGYVSGMAGGYVAGGYAGGYPGGYAGGIVGGIAQGGYAGGYPGGIAGGYVAGGYAGGYPGGYAGGMAGGYPGGMAGGFVNGISIAGGIAGGGYPGGMAGGYAAGGYAGGYPGGYAGGFAGGIAGGYAQGGYAGGYPGGYAGGMAGGMAAGGYAGGYMAGGYNGGYAGGYVNGGYAAGGYAGGMAGGMAGGYQDYASSQQAANYDRMMQQQGTAFQMGMGGMGGYTGGGFGSAGYYPQNAGFTLGGSIGIGGGFGGYAAGGAGYGGY